MLASRRLFSTYIRSSNIRLHCDKTWLCFSTSMSHSNERRPDRLYERLQIDLRAHQPDVLKSYSW